jgi:hypothetical protein
MKKKNEDIDLEIEKMPENYRFKIKKIKNNYEIELAKNFGGILFHGMLALMAEAHTDYMTYMLYSHDVDSLLTGFAIALAKIGKWYLIGLFIDRLYLRYHMKKNQETEIKEVKDEYNNSKTK